MKVLVTGGAGYIGCCTVELLLKEGFEVVVFDNFNWGKTPLDPFKDRIEVIQGDCRNSKDIIYALNGIDAIIHLAGIVGEFSCANYPKAHFSTNVESTRTIINCCTDPELDLVRDFIYVSSCSVYGNLQNMYDNVIETTPTFPLSAYAYSKQRSEQLVLQRAKEVPHFHPTILRLTTVFGWSNRPRLDLVTNLFVYKALKDKKITIFGDGIQYRSLIHVQDVASAIVTTLKAPRFLRSNHILHVGNEENNRTVKEIATEVADAVPGTTIQFKDAASTDRRDYKINCSKIRNMLGWNTKFSVRDGIDEVVNKLTELDWDWESPNYRNNKFDYL